MVINYPEEILKFTIRLLERERVWDIYYLECQNEDDGTAWDWVLLPLKKNISFMITKNIIL